MIADHDHSVVGNGSASHPNGFLHRQHLTCCYTNAQGFLNKFSELQLRFQSWQWDIVAVTETWLTADILDSELRLPGMSLFRCDRPTRGGGVLLYFRSNLQCELLDIPDSAPDTLWCRLRLFKHDECLIGVVYRSPSSPDSANEALLQTMRHTLSLRFTHVLIMGDFNCPKLAKTVTSRPLFDHQFKQLMDSHPLYNHVKEPTRFGTSQSPSILDLVLTSEELMVESVDIAPPIGRSDHAVLTFKYICYASMNKSLQSNDRTFIDYAGLQTMARVTQWASVDEIGDPLVSWQNFSDSLSSLITSVTTVKPAIKSSTRNSPIRSRTRKWMSRRDQSWRQYKRSPHASTWNTYRRLRNHCTKLAREDKLMYQEKLAHKFLANPKLLYKHVNAARKVQHGIPVLDYLGRVSNTTMEAAEMLKEHYSEVFSAPAREGLRLPRLLQCFSHPLLNIITFTTEKVKAKLLTLRRNSSPGADNIHPQTLIYLANHIAEPLAALFQRMFDNTTVPQSWKHGVISPIYKGGCRSDPANYRPVTLLPVLSKVMESVVADFLMEHLENCNILSPAQHGFRKNRSCTTNLLLARDVWTRAVDGGDAVDVVYLDFSKAFDRVNHQVLLRKLYNYGIQGLALDWIEVFLRQRTVSVRVSDSISDPVDVTRGVPQGSVLGPRLFLTFINDLPEVLGPQVLLFADDAKIWKTVTEPEGSLELQGTLNAAHDWSIMNDMEFNGPKCKVLSLRHNRRFPYFLGNQQLAHASSEKDLGVIIQEDLSCSPNCARASSTAMKQVGLLKRVFGRFEPKLIPQLLSAYIRPHIEYAIQAWSPWLQRDRQALERPQRIATKMVKGLSSTTYDERLRILGLYSTQYRRIRGDLILVYHTLQQPNHPCRSLLTLSPNVHLRGHPFKLVVRKSQLNCRRHSFAVRVCTLWNSLPHHVVCAPSIDAFKLRLDEALGDLLFLHT